MAGVLGRSLDRVRDRLHLVVRELMKFGVVGAVAYVVDVGVFNLVRFAGPRLLEDKPLTAKIVSVAVATVVAWLGNRHWTFRRRRRPAAARELVVFAVMNVIGLAIGLACLAVSHYVLDLRSPLADNVSANGVGLVLGTAFRFVAYRTWVFTGGPVDPRTGLDPADASDGPEDTVGDRGGDRQGGRRRR